MLFRETGIVIGIAFFVLILLHERHVHLRAAAFFSVLSITLVVLVLLSDVSISRPSLAPLNLVVFDERQLYANAYFLDEINPGRSIGCSRQVRKLTYNTRTLGRVFTSVAREFLNPNAGPLTPVSAFEVVSLGLIVMSIPLGLIGLRKRALEPFLLACVAVPVTLLIAILSLYFVLYLQGVRILLLAVPFECIVWAAVLHGVWRTLDTRGWLQKTRQILTAAGLGAGLVAAIGLTYSVLAPDPAERLHADREAAFLESVDARSRLCPGRALANRLRLRLQTPERGVVVRAREPGHTTSARSNTRGETRSSCRRCIPRPI